jgi:hypothetical protein
LTKTAFFLGVSTVIFPDWDSVTYEHFSVEPSPWGQGAALDY